MIHTLRLVTHSPAHDFKRLPQENRALQSALQLPSCSSCARSCQLCCHLLWSSAGKEGALLGTGLKGGRVLQAGRTPQKQSKGDCLGCDFHPRTRRARSPVSPLGSRLCPSGRSCTCRPQRSPCAGIDTASAVTPNLAERPPLCPRRSPRSLPNPIEHRFRHRARTNKGRSSNFR